MHQFENVKDIQMPVRARSCLSAENATAVRENVMEDQKMPIP